MIMKLYCKQCGGATPYTLNKPRFCSTCGQSFSSTARGNESSTRKPAPAQTPVVLEKPMEEESEEPQTIPDIQGLDVEISESAKMQGVKFGDVLGSSVGNEQNFTREIGPELSEEESAAQFKKEAGSIRNKENTAPQKK